MAPARKRRSPRRFPSARIGAEQRQSRAHDPLHRLYRRRKQSVRRDLLLLLRKALLDAAPPREPNLGIDVHDLVIKDPVALESALNQIPGVVTVGLFAQRPADVLLIGSDAGVRQM